MKEVLITGGAGYIGSHCAVSLFKNKYKPIILDNFSNSSLKVIKRLKTILKKDIIFYNQDLRNKDKLKKIFKKHNLHSVIHCAGLKSVYESILKPTSYYENNIGSTLSLIETMKEYKVYNLIFSSSATVYNNSNSPPFKETDSTGNTSNPYGSSKYLIEKILVDLVKYDQKWNIKIARYFNPISNHSSGLIKDNPKGIPNNLMPVIVKVAQKKIPFLKIFGNDYKTKDGTCVRDYIHVMDLADGHTAMLKNKKGKKGLQIYNFGTGKGLSVLDVIRAFEKKTGTNIAFKYTSRRKGDVPVSFCNPQKALKELNWKTKISFDQAIIDISKTI